MRLLDQVRYVIRRKHYSIRTEQAYVNWIRQYILFHKKHHPKDMKEFKSDKTRAERILTMHGQLTETPP